MYHMFRLRNFSDVLIAQGREDPGYIRLCKIFGSGIHILGPLFINTPSLSKFASSRFLDSSLKQLSRPSRDKES